MEDNYKLTIDFKANDKDSKAFYEALLQICEAWSRHKRIVNPKCELDKK
ncbi:MAG: hypothetical protein QNJ31_01625 [Candidatus Caenarcaniphilales bacterium]|nr:hypothetical protein [Candidatus Caenarcaniphilales bacterium]